MDKIAQLLHVVLKKAQNKDGRQIKCHVVLKKVENKDGRQKNAKSSLKRPKTRTGGKDEDVDGDKDEYIEKGVYMKKFLLSLVFIAALSPTAMSAQENDLCFWNAISMKKDVAQKWTVGVRAEHRANNDASTTQQYYLRPMVDFKILPWMTATAQADFAWMSTGFNIRVMPQVVFTYKSNGFDLSLRQRLQATWKQPDNSWNFLFRTKAQARYRIPGTPLSPLVAVEPYYMEEFARTRYYAGLTVNVTKSLSILMEYVYQDHYTKSIDDNVLWLTFSVKL